MTLLYLEALVAIGLSLAVLMTGAWLLWRKTGNSGWVDTVWTFRLGRSAPPARWCRWASRLAAAPIIVAVLARSGRRGSAAHRHAHDEDHRRSALCRHDQGLGQDAPRQMFILLQKQALVSIPLAFAMFVAAHHPGAGI